MLVRVHESHHVNQAYNLPLRWSAAFWSERSGSQSPHVFDSFQFYVALHTLTERGGKERIVGFLGYRVQLRKLPTLNIRLSLTIRMYQERGVIISCGKEGIWLQTVANTWKWRTVYKNLQGENWKFEKVEMEFYFTTYWNIQPRITIFPSLGSMGSLANMYPKGVRFWLVSKASMSEIKNIREKSLYQG